VKDGAIFPSDKQPVRMTLDMINNDSMTILIKPSFTYLDIISKPRIVFTRIEIQTYGYLFDV
jgi:delta-aminolevulinic acid dehydratase/porphobilinogen synthase